MSDFYVIERLMKQLFSRDYQFALATSNHNEVHNRFVDTYYENNAFYIVTYGTSKKVQDILVNDQVALTCRKLYSFQGKAVHLGHPLKEDNELIRNQLIHVFKDWYFQHNNELDPLMCYIKIDITKAFFHLDGIGYSVDFINRSVEQFPFFPSINYTEE